VDFINDGVAPNVVAELKHRNTGLRQLLKSHECKLFGPGQNVASFLISAKRQDIHMSIFNCANSVCFIVLRNVSFVSVTIVICD